MKLKALVPKKLKLELRLLKRKWIDRNVCFAGCPDEIQLLEYSISTTQEIKPGLFFENKVHNLKTASERISKIVIGPGEVFSFWKTVGIPNVKNGFRKGRNIIKGKVSEEIGGGLCQISSIVYLTALKASLDVTERYNHSVDIYREEERFTPLGADATVVYGYKDLRLRNNLNFPVCFAFRFEENQLVCELQSPQAITELHLDFQRNYDENTVEVETKANGKRLCVSVYKIMA